ncbi:Uncharacterised protein [Mycobacteroides abscessus subsp. bolletii]|uniref:hypothetical protein n=1 Tax=Mycobacteroides abscessus TaxID=36809 RepID=UPI0003061951|nr:hypothetical protein [Mycobacteroides abscessus]SHY39295.1 Uncharacterised protein [Mycobacteroides abscessus subsp. bolletii]SKP94278.1 Uncharacterised protein [Mycobacteroides abscessus subsp. bolletii]
MFESQVKAWTADQQRRSRQEARWDQLLKNSVAGASTRDAQALTIINRLGGVQQYWTDHIGRTSKPR